MTLTSTNSITSVVEYKRPGNDSPLDKDDWDYWYPGSNTNDEPISNSAGVVQFKNDLYSISTSKVIYKSTDGGTTWAKTGIVINSTGSVQSVAAGNGRMVAIDSKGSIFVTTTGDKWFGYQESSGTAKSIYFYNDKFYIYRNTEGIMSSPDGGTWTVEWGIPSKPTNHFEYWADGIVAGEEYLMVGGSGSGPVYAYRVSTDTWSELNTTDQTRKGLSIGNDHVAYFDNSSTRFLYITDHVSGKATTTSCTTYNVKADGSLGNQVSGRTPQTFYFDGTRWLGFDPSNGGQLLVQFLPTDPGSTFANDSRFISQPFPNIPQTFYYARPLEAFGRLFIFGTGRNNQTSSVQSLQNNILRLNIAGAQSDGFTDNMEIESLPEGAEGTAIQVTDAYIDVPPDSAWQAGQKVVSAYDQEPTEPPSILEDTDTFLVNRSGKTYQLQAQNVMAVQDDDLLLVNRGGKSYKVTASELKKTINKGEGIADLISGGTLYEIRDLPLYADVRIFETDGNLVVGGTKSVLMDLLIIAGGGGGGKIGGGGGAGGVIEMQLEVPPGTHSITVGSYGRGGNNDGNTSLNGEDGEDTVLTIGGTTYTAIGGGGGVQGAGQVGGDGGSGGGGTNGGPGGNGVPGQGNGGGSSNKTNSSPGGGGGGYGGPGQDIKFLSNQWSGGYGGPGGTLNWGLPDSVNATINGLTHFAAGGSGSFPVSNLPHGGIEGSYGSGGTSLGSVGVTVGRNGAAGVVLVRYVIWQ